MSAHPKDLLNVAKELAKQGGDEATTRSIVNRAYYAAYHAAKSFHSALPSPGSVGGASGSHQQLISALDNPTILRSHDKFWASKALGKSLRLTFSLRVIADYHLHKNMLSEEGKLVIAQASEILNRTGHN